MQAGVGREVKQVVMSVDVDGSEGAALDSLVATAERLLKLRHYQAVLDLLAVSAPMPSSLAYLRGEALVNLGRYAEALESFEMGLVQPRYCVDAHIGRAVCLLHLQRPEAAMAACDRVLAIAPHHPQAWLFRGVALHRLAHYRDAYRCYEQAIGTPRPDWGSQLKHGLRSWLKRLENFASAPL